jgi:hypothetical protein
VADCFLFIGIAVFLLVQILDRTNQKSYYNGQLVNDRFLQVNPDAEAPIKLLLKNKITGPVFNEDVLGGLMIWLGYPGLRPFLDTRTIDWGRFNRFRAILLYPKEVWPTAQRDYNFKIVILDTAISYDLPFIRYFNTQLTWQLISVNGPLVTFVKRGEFHLPKELKGFEALLKSHDVSTDDLRNLKMLTEGKNVLMSQGFFHPSVTYVDLYPESFSLLMLGYKGAAVEDLVKALKISNPPGGRNRAGIILELLDKIPNHQ